MPDPNTPETPPNAESTESFDQLLTQHEQAQKAARQEGRRQLEGVVVSVKADSVYLDIGYKTEGILPLAAFKAGEEPKRGDKFPVSVKGRDPDGYYQLSRSRVELPKDWPALERAFTERATIMGTVTAVVKGGLSVDVGVRAFMPASRSGARDAAEMEKLVGQEIRCRIIKLDVADEDVVVDRRAVGEDDERAAKQRRFEELKEGDTVQGAVRSLTDYGAFVDIGGADALLHVGEISWSRVNKPADALSVGQEIQAKIISIDSGKRRVAISLKQLQPHPWDAAAGKHRVNDRVRGTVTRIVDFGAFVELEPGVEGLIHISELSWTKRVKRVSEVVKQGDTVDAVVLAVNPAERRISLGLKQALGDPWAEAPQKFCPGTVVEGPVTSLTNFGAFVQLAEGLEGMIHVGNISAEKRINHPKDVLSVGQVVRAQVLEIDPERRRIALGIKQLAPSGLDEYLSEHKQGETVTGRVLEISGDTATVELGEGIVATCSLSAASGTPQPKPAAAKADLSALTSMLNARWKGSSSAAAAPSPVSSGQVRSFRISALDAGTKKIELELA
ncbi:MAG: 30S ribosomal protein S1 [Terriglobales bacterium]